MNDWADHLDRPGRQEIANALINAITGGEFEPGAVLPSVRNIASRCGVAPNTAREALAIVARQGHARVLIGRGYTVVDNPGLREQLEALERRMMTVAMAGGPNAAGALEELIAQHRTASAALAEHYLSPIAKAPTVQ